MNKLMTKMNIKLGTALAMSLFLVLAAGLALAPRVVSRTKAESCSPTYTQPVFSPYPITWGENAGFDCTDFAVLSGNVQGAGVWADNFQAKAGDTISMRIYVHNGAGSNSGAVMNNVNVSTNIDTSVGSNHTVSTTLSASNAASKTGTVNISTEPGTHLELVSGDTNFSVGDLQPCFEYAKIYRFTLRVVADAPAQTPSAQISATPAVRIAGQCLFNSNITWSSQNVSSAVIEVTDLKDNVTNVMGYNVNDATDAAWMKSDRTYRFTFYDTTSGKTRLASTDVSTGSCEAAPTPSGQISATPAVRIAGQCLFNSNVTWSTQNVTSAVVEVTDLKSNVTNVMGYNLNDTTDAAWMNPSRTYRFTLYNTTSGKTRLASTDVTTGSCDVAPTPSAQISATPAVRIAGQCLFNSNITWSSQNVSSAVIEVTDLKDNVTNVMGYNVNDATDAAWMKSDRTYRFTFYDTTSGKTRLASTDVSTGFCEVTPPPAKTPTGTITARVTSRIDGQCLYNGIVTWTSQNVTSVVVEATDLKDNVTNVMGYNLNDTTDAAWMKPDRSYRFVLYNTSGAFKNELARYTLAIPTLDCGTPPPVYQDVVCSVYPSNINAGQSATFTAANGDNTYSWIVSGGSVTSSNKKSFSSTFANAGSYVATVYSNGKQASCNVQVNQNICIANSNFALNAGTPIKNGSVYTSTISWTSTGNNQIKITKINPDGSVEDFASGNATGSKQANNLQPGSTYIFRMYDTSCNQYLTSVQVSTPANPQTLTCAADYSSYNVNSSVTFRATGGSGGYAWTNGGSPASGNGSVFNTAFSSAGIKTVGVISGDGQTANCSVVINQQVVEKGLVNLSKEVRNITGSETTFSHSVSAKQNDTVEYRIKVWAGSSVDLTNVVVTDTFASGLSYVEGSLTVNGQAHASGLTSGGLSFDKVTQTPVIIIYRAKVTATVGSLVNTASATASNANNTANDQALVNISYVNPGQPALSITKQVKNVTQNTSYDTSVLANKNDSVKFQVIVKNIGQAAAKNVYINDSNPSQLQPLRNIAVSGKSFTGGIPQGISIGDLALNETVTITYEATVKAESGTIVNVATVSADNAASQNASASISITTQPNNPGGDTTYNYCVNYSCNTNITNITNTTTTNTTNTTNNNYTYNNYSYVYINNSGTTVPANQFSQLGIAKSVRNSNGGAFSNSVSVNNNDTVEFEIVVTNTGNQTVNNVRLTDNLYNGLSLVGGSLRVDGSYVSDSNLSSGMYLGSLSVGQQKRINFQARVNSGSSSSIQNIASVSGDNVSSVQDDAWVFVNTGWVQGGNVSLTYSKTAVNETKNQNAVSVVASKEDYITYTLTAANNGNTPANNFVITDDLSQVLPYADIVDNGGGSVSGNVITFPGLTVPAYGSVSRSFKVRVKYSLADNLAYTMTNTYGNTLTIRINTPQVQGAFIAPKTGAETGAFAFSGLLTAATALIRRRKDILKLIFT